MNESLEVLKTLTGKETTALLAAIAACATALTSIVMFIRDQVRYRRENEFKMDEEYDSLMKDCEVFWTTTLRQAYKGFRDKAPQAPDHLENLIRSCGVPPNLLTTDELRAWPAQKQR